MVIWALGAASPLRSVALGRSSTRWPVRLRFAMEKGFEPGVWRPSDVEESRPEDRSFGSRLRNLGVAVGVNL